MLRATDEERNTITDYYLGQSPAGTEVRFLQKVYSEAVLGHRHDVWDVHSSDGRWWVITNPTNLYSQDQFPNMDLAVTFHMGLCLRLPRSQPLDISRRQAEPFGDVLRQIQAIDDTLHHAYGLAEYQGIGVRCREALLAFVSAVQDATDWPGDETPKRADFRAWNELIWNTVLAGGGHADRRRLMKTSMSEAWVFANWLTHAKSATWQDAEAASATLACCLSLATSVMIRHLRGVPDQCPDCGSRRLEPEEGVNPDLPEIVLERPTCMDCGWTGPVTPVGEREKDEIEQIITREGAREDGCIIPTVPLMELAKPGGRKG